MRYIYPAIFTYDRVKKIYKADFPDVPGCHANGHSMEDVFDRARLSLGRTLLEMEEGQVLIPAPSDTTLLRLRNRGCTICAVMADTSVERTDRAQRMAEASSWNEKETQTGKGYAHKISHVFGIKV